MFGQVNFFLIMWLIVKFIEYILTISIDAQNFKTCGYHSHDLEDT